MEYFAIRQPDGEIDLSTISQIRHKCISNFEKQQGLNWVHLRSYLGYKCIKIQVNYKNKTKSVWKNQ